MSKPPKRVVMVEVERRKGFNGEPIIYADGMLGSVRLPEGLEDIDVIVRVLPTPASEAADEQPVIHSHSHSRDVPCPVCRPQEYSAPLTEIRDLLHALVKIKAIQVRYQAIVGGPVDSQITNILAALNRTGEGS